MVTDKKLVIFGVGSFAKLAYVYFSEDSPHQIAAFTAHESSIRPVCGRWLSASQY
jgi:hypothetical protein